MPGTREPGRLPEYYRARPARRAIMCVGALREGGVNGDETLANGAFAHFLPAASTTSSKLLNPGVGAFTSTAILPGKCSFFHILV